MLTQFNPRKKKGNDKTHIHGHLTVTYGEREAVIKEGVTDLTARDHCPVVWQGRIRIVGLVFVRVTCIRSRNVGPVVVHLLGVIASDVTTVVLMEGAKLKDNVYLHSNSIVWIIKAHQKSLRIVWENFQHIFFPPCRKRGFSVR